MKTTILEDLDLPEDRRAALSRESLRTGRPVCELIKDYLLEKADQLITAAEGSKPTQPGSNVRVAA